MVGVESLLRWLNPPEGLESPAEIVAIAEESTLIVQLGERRGGQVVMQLSRPVRQA